MSNRILKTSQQLRPGFSPVEIHRRVYQDLSQLDVALGQIQDIVEGLGGSVTDNTASLDALQNQIAGLQIAIQNLTTQINNLPAGAGLVFVAAPATNASTGAQGNVAYDGAYFYICVAVNSWIRIPMNPSWQQLSTMTVWGVAVPTIIYVSAVNAGTFVRFDTDGGISILSPVRISIINTATLDETHYSAPGGGGVNAIAAQSGVNANTQIVFDNDGGITLISPIRISFVNATTGDRVDYSAPGAADGAAAATSTFNAGTQITFDSDGGMTISSPVQIRIKNTVTGDGVMI